MTSTIVGNSKERGLVCSWLLGKPSNLLLVGEHGIGKHATLNELFAKHNFKAHSIHPGTFKSPNSIYDLVQMCFNKLRDMHEHVTKPVIVVENVNNLSSSTEKDNIALLLKMNKENALFPIVIVCGPEGSKFTNVIANMCTVIKFNPPTLEELKGLVVSIFKEKGMKVKTSTVYNDIVQVSTLDVRQLVAFINELHASYGTKTITEARVAELKASKNLKHAYKSTCELVKNTLDTFSGVNEALDAYNADRMMLPIGIFNNYYKRTNNVSNLANTAENISMADVVENAIYQDQAWHLFDVHGLYSTAAVSHCINKCATLVPEYKAELSVDINRTSLRNMYHKQAEGIMSDFPFLTLEDVFYMAATIAEQSNTAFVNKLKQCGLNNKQLDLLTRLGKMQTNCYD